MLGRVGLPNWGKGVCTQWEGGSSQRASRGAFLLDIPISACFTRANRGAGHRESIPLGLSVAICHVPPKWKVPGQFWALENRLGLCPWDSWQLWS